MISRVNLYLSNFIYICRVVILVIVMLIVVPLLNIIETDNTQSIAVELLQRMAVYNENNSTAYGVSTMDVAFDE